MTIIKIGGTQREAIAALGLEGDLCDQSVSTSLGTIPTAC
jgi:hypothetical protein